MGLEGFGKKIVTTIAAAAALSTAQAQEKPEVFHYKNDSAIVKKVGTYDVFKKYDKNTTQQFQEPTVVYDKNDSNLKKYNDSEYAYMGGEKLASDMERVMREDDVYNKNLPLDQRNKRVQVLQTQMNDFANEPRVFNIDPTIDYIKPFPQSKGDNRLKLTRPVIPHWKKPIHKFLFKEKPPEYIKEQPSWHAVYGPNGGLIGDLSEWGDFVPVANVEHLSAHDPRRDTTEGGWDSKDDPTDIFDVHHQDRKIVEQYYAGRIDPFIENQAKFLREAHKVEQKRQEILEMMNKPSN